MWHRFIAVSLSLLVLPATVLAAGFEYPENGARALARGGAFVASGDDPTLIQHNPAGLAGLDGLRISLDGQAVWWATEYQRLVQTGEGDWTDVDPITGERMRPVSNAHSPWLTPFLSATYQAIDGLTLALAVYGPSAVGLRRYPDAREIAPFFWDGVYEENEENAREIQEYISRRAPQRYSMIELLNLVAFPTLSVGWEPLSWLRVGASGQLVYAMMRYSLSMRSDDVAFLIGGDGPEADIIGELDVSTRRLGMTGILGVQVRPMEQLSIGMTVRPGFTLRQEGTFRLYFNDLQANEDFLGLRQGRDDAIFTSTIPTVYRLGIAWQQGGWLGEIAGSYERLSVVDAYVLEPFITIEHNFDNLLPPIEVDGEEILFEKNWRDTFGLRVGAGVDLRRAFGLTLPIEAFAGYAFERGAIPKSTQNLDFVSQNRSQATLGLGYDLGRARLSAAFSRTFEPTIEVRDSKVFMIDDASFNPAPGTSPEERQDALTMVGDGNYESAHTMLMLSIESRFGSARAAR